MRHFLQKTPNFAYKQTVFQDEDLCYIHMHTLDSVIMTDNYTHPHIFSHTHTHTHHTLVVSKF